MKNKFKVFFIVITLIPQIFLLSGCFCSEFFSDIKNSNSGQFGGGLIDGNISIPDYGEDDLENETYDDQYRYAGISEAEWNILVSRLETSTLKNISFETKNATVQGKRNKGLLAVYEQSSEKDFNILTQYLDEQKLINYNEKGEVDSALNKKYSTSKIYLAYTAKKMNKKYEYCIIFFEGEGEFNNNKYAKKTLIISIMECVDSQNMTPLQHSQMWMSKNELVEFKLDNILPTNGMLLLNSKPETLPCKYGDSKRFEADFDGSFEQFDNLIKKIYNAGYKYDSSGNEYNSYKHSKLYNEDSSISFIAYMFIDNVDYYINVRYYERWGISFFARFETNKKEEDMRKTWLTEEEKQYFAINVDINDIKPNFGTLKDVEKYSLVFQFATFYFTDVTKEDVEEYCKEKIFKILGANIDYEDETTVYDECIMTSEDALGNINYEAIYLLTSNDIYSVKVTYHGKGNNIWVGGLYTYYIEKNSMTITFQKNPLA